MALNKVLLIGNVGKEPEVRHLESGAAVASFTLATTERFKDKSGEMKELTEWHNIVAWRQLADLASNYIHKGSQIYVEGRIRSRSWDDQNGMKRYVTEILADTIQLLGRREGGQGVPTGGAYSEPAAPVQTASRAAEPRQSTPVISPADLAADGSDDLPF